MYLKLSFTNKVTFSNLTNRPISYQTAARTLCNPENIWQNSLAVPSQLPAAALQHSNARVLTNSGSSYQNTDKVSIL